MEKCTKLPRNNQPEITDVYFTSGVPIEDLKLICSTVKTPSFERFREILEMGNTIIDGNSESSSFFSEWHDFHCLPYISSSLASMYPENDLFSSLDSQVQVTMNFIGTAKETMPSPDGQQDSAQCDLMVYEDSLERAHEHTQSLCYQLKNIYLPKIIDLGINDHAMLFQHDIIRDTHKANIPNTFNHDKIVSLIGFMKNYCEKQSNNLLESRKKSIQKAHQNNTIKLPDLAKKWKQGQTKYYKASDLTHNWEQYSTALPNIPELDRTKVNQKWL